MRVIRNQVPEHAVKIALKYIKNDVGHDQLTWGVHRYAPEIMQLLAYLPSLADPKSELCEPQIVWQYPEGQWKSDGVQMHVDKIPPWATLNRSYSEIISVALTRADEMNGAVIFKRGEHERVQPILKAGDVVTFDGDEEHVTGVFHPGGNNRIAVYFRFLDQPAQES